jgi:WD40 repeat protein
VRHAVVTLLLTASAALLATGASARAQPPSNTDAFGDPLPAGAFYRLGTVRLRHQSTQTMHFSADGSQVLSQGYGMLRLWDVASGALKRQLPAPKGGRLIASPDDRFLAGVADDKVVLADKASGHELARWDHARSWDVLAFSKDGKELVGLTAGQTVVRWSTDQRKEIGRVRLDVANVDVKRFPDSNRWRLSPDAGIAAFLPPVATDEESTTWHFWDTATGKQCRPSIKTDASPDQVCWSPDGRRIAVVVWDNTVVVWDCFAGKRLPFRAGKALPPTSSYSPRGVAFHPGGKLLAVANSGSIAVWDVDANKPLWTKEQCGDLFAFSRDGKSLAIGGCDIISLVGTASGKPVGGTQRDPGSISPAWAWGWGRTAFCADGQSYMVYDAAGISQIETATGKRIRSFSDRKSEDFTYGGLCHGGRLFLRVVRDKEDKAHVFAYDPTTGKELWRRPNRPMLMQASADGKTLAVLSWKQDELALIDAWTGREIRKLMPTAFLYDGNSLTTLADDASLAASAHNRGGINLWDMSTGKKIRTLDGPQGSAQGYLSFVPGNKLLVSSRHRRYVHKIGETECAAVWDVDTGGKLHAFDESIYEMSPDGRWVACETGKGIAIRHLRTGKLIATIAGSFQSTYSNPPPLTFSPDSSMVAVRGKEDEFGIWDTLTGQRVGTLVNPRFQLGSVAFSPDSRTLLLSDYGGGSLLVCDVTRRAASPGKIAAQELTRAETERHWLDLTSDEGARCHQARWTLVAGGSSTVKFLKQILQREEPIDAKKLAALLAALDSGNFKDRDVAMRELDRIPLLRPALETALTQGPSLEMRRRIEIILSKQAVHSPRAIRGVLLLEQIATPEARELLQRLASGATGSMWTQEAQAARERLRNANP